MQVIPSSCDKMAKASVRFVPQNSGSALKPPHTLGLSGEWNMAHPKSCVRWMQRTPAALPLGMPGMGDDMDGAMQQAPQFVLQFMAQKYILNLFFAT